MARKLMVGVIGLGKFGFRFGQTLIELGHQVLGIDTDANKIKRAQHRLTQTYQGDATDKTLLAQLGLSDFTHILISVGSSIEASVMIAMYLKELGVPTIWVKAISEDHEKLLHKIGVDEVIMPEHYAARQMANRLAIPGFIEYLPFGKDMALRELNVDAWGGKSLREIDMTNQLHVQVIAIKRTGESQFGFIPKPDVPLEKDDVLIIMGPAERLSSLKP